LWLLLFLDANVVLLLPEQKTSKSRNHTVLVLVMNAEPDHSHTETSLIVECLAARGIFNVSIPGALIIARI